MAVGAMGMVVCWLFGFIYCDLLKMTEPVDISMNFYLTRVFPIGAVQVRYGPLTLSTKFLTNTLLSLLTMPIGCGHVPLKQPLPIPHCLLYRDAAGDAASVHYDCALCDGAREADVDASQGGFTDRARLPHLCLRRGDQDHQSLCSLPWISAFKYYLKSF